MFLGAYLSPRARPRWQRLRALVAATVTATTLAYGAMAKTDGTNLILDPEFDLFDGGLPDGWTVGSWNQEFVQAEVRQASPGRNGTGSCVELAKGSPIGVLTLRSPSYAVTPGEAYVFEGYYASSCETIRVSGQWIDGVGDPLGSFELKLPETQEAWVEFFDDVRSPDDAESLGLVVEKRWQDGRARFDDLSLRRGKIRDYAEEFSLPPLEPGQLRFPIFVTTTAGKGLQGDWEAECALANFSVGQARATYGLLRRIPLAKANSMSDAELTTANGDPGVWGISGPDEPGESRFAELAELNERFKRFAPSKPLIVNLLPTYGFASYADYEHYVGSFIETVKPSLFTYDHYALGGRTPDAGYGRDFFANLEIVRREAQARDVEWGVILLVVAHGSQRSPNEAELRWQAYNALAYGARALGWFTYDTEVEYGGWNWRDAVIQRDGSRTRHYSMLRRVNGEVLRLGDRLLRMESTGVFHTQPLPELTGDISSSELIAAVGEGDWAIGEFVDGTGLRYFMLVSRDFTAEQTATITFQSTPKALFEISKSDGTAAPVEEFDPGSASVVLTLSPGDGRLFAVQ